MSQHAFHYARSSIMSPNRPYAKLADLWQQDCRVKMAKYKFAAGATASFRRLSPVTLRWQCSRTLTLNSCYIGRVLSAIQTNGCGRAPPNFAPRWIAMQGALWKLRER